MSFMRCLALADRGSGQVNSFTFRLELKFPFKSAVYVICVAWMTARQMIFDGNKELAKTEYVPYCFLS